MNCFGSLILMLENEQDKIVEFQYCVMYVCSISYLCECYQQVQVFVQDHEQRKVVQKIVQPGLQILHPMVH